MKEFFSSKKFIVIVCIAALMVGVMIYAAVSSETVVSSALGTVFSPLQKFSQSISESVSGTLDMLFNAKSYYEENRELKEEIARLTEQMVDYTEIKQENQHFREMLLLSQESPGIEFSEPCDVIGRVANDPFGSFFIDKGEMDGIGYYDPVVTASGLVGFVTRVEYTYSLVTPILSNDISLGVYCVRTGETGITEGSYTLAADGNIRLLYIPLDCEMYEGDILVTSGYSGLVPKGLVVGRADTLETSSNGLSKTCTVTPTVDVSTLKTVYVITDFQGKGSAYEE